LQKYNLPYPEAVFDVGFYRKNPRPFLNLAKELWPGLNHSPTLTHSFVSLLSKRNKLLRNYTQNIDGLEHLSLIQEEHLLECHGHFRTASCCRCGTAMEGEACKRIILETDKVPLCVKCNSYVKPDIVFFGQGLPERFHRQLPMDVAVADLLLVIGTSLQVAPVSLIPEYVRCKRILINRELVGDFDETTDAVVLGECDDICVELARQLDWETQLHELNQETRIQKSPTKKDANEETDRME
jgi:NAD-dependent SIR2 family protein deacetylase